MFLAFTIEAYVNHLAASKITDWSKRERELGQSRRLRLLLSAVGLDPSFEERPFRSVAELFEIRDQLTFWGQRQMRRKADALLDRESNFRQNADRFL